MMNKKLPPILFSLLLSAAVFADSQQQPLQENPRPQLDKSFVTDVNLDPHGFLELLKKRDYESIEARVDALQMRYEQNTEEEQQLMAALEVFDIADPGMAEFFSNWVEEHPGSYAARLAQGIYWHSMGWKLRGTAFSNKTAPLKFQRMSEAFKLSEESLRLSLGLTKKPIASLRYLTKIAQDNDERQIWLQMADEIDPYNTSVKMAYVHFLLPRWGGSHQAMDAMATSLYKSRHRKLLRLADYIEARILLDKGYVKSRNKEYTVALDYYQKAAEKDRNSRTLNALGTFYKDMGQFDIAISHYLSSLEIYSFNEVALRNLAYIYFEKRDYPVAFNFLNAAAILSDRWAMRRWASILIEGKYGAPANIESGIAWYERAAQLLDEKALHHLGYMYEEGRGVKVNHEKAVQYYEQAAQLLDEKVLLRLGNMYAQGLGVMVNHEKAAQYYERCSSLGIMCKNNFALMLWYGRGIERDVEYAAKLWHEVAASGEWRGAHNLEFFYTPLERLNIAFKYGPGRWVLWPLIGAGAAFVGVILLFVIVSLRINRKQRAEQ